jgi:hypothetical protein
MGLYPSAVRHLEMAVKREPNTARNAHLTMANAKNGDRTRAKQAAQGMSGRNNPGQ